MSRQSSMRMVLPFVVVSFLFFGEIAVEKAQTPLSTSKRKVPKLLRQGMTFGLGRERQCQ